MKKQLFYLLLSILMSTNAMWAQYPAIPYHPNTVQPDFYPAPTEPYKFSDWITNVSFAGINNTTANPGWRTQYTGTTGAVTRGQTYTISITVNPASNPNPDFSYQHISAYIDWDRNGDCGGKPIGHGGTGDIPGECYALDSGASHSNPITFSITVPNDAALGTTWLRVTLKADGLPVADAYLGYFGFGEIEEYPITVSSGNAAPQLTSPAPNAINQPRNLTFRWEAVNDAQQYNIQVSTSENMSNPIINQTVSQLNYQVTSLIANQLYYWRVKAISGTNNSEWSEVRSFTTVADNKVYYYPNSENPKIVMVVQDGQWQQLSNTKKVTNQTVLINNFIKFVGNMEINTSTATLSTKGRFIIENFSMPFGIKTDLVLYDKELRNIELDDTKFRFNSVGTGIVFHELKEIGLSIYPTKLEFIGGLHALEMKLGGKIKIDLVKNCNNYKENSELVFDDITFRKNVSDGSFEMDIDFEANGFGFSPFNYYICLNSARFILSTDNDKWRVDLEAQATFNILNTNTEIDLGASIINGKINGGSLSYSTAKPFFPIGNTGLGLSGLSGSITGLVEPPLDITAACSLRSITNPRLFQLSGEFVMSKKNEDFKNDYFGLNMEGDFFQLQRVGAINEWLAKAEVEGRFYHNAGRLEFLFGAKCYRLKSENGSYSNDYLLEIYKDKDGKKSSFVINNLFGFWNFSGSARATVQIPKFQIDNVPWIRFWERATNEMKEYFNKKVAGYKFDVDVLFNNDVFSASITTDVIGTFGFKYFTSDNTFDIDLPFADPFTLVLNERDSLNNTPQNYKQEVRTISDSISRALVFIEGVTELPKSRIISPSGILYSTSSIDNGIVYDTLENINSVVWTVLNPELGNWTVRSDSLTDLYSFYAFQLDYNPNVQLTLILDTLNFTWFSNNDSTSNMEFYLYTDTTELANVYIGSVGNLSTSYTFNLPDTLNNCRYYAKYLLVKSDSSLYSSGFLPFEITNNNPRLPKIDGVNAYFNILTNKTYIEWQKANQPSIAGYQFVIYDTIHNDTLVYNIENYRTPSVIIERNLSNFKVNFSTYDNNDNTGCSDSTIINIASNSKDVPKEAIIQAALGGLWNGTYHKPAVVQIELRSGSALFSSILVAKAYGSIDSNCYIRTNFENVEDGSYWLIIRATGYAPIASAQRVSIQSGVEFNYDFSRSTTSVFQTAMLKQIGDRYVMRAGDFDSDRRVTATDVNTLKQNLNSNTSIIPAP